MLWSARALPGLAPPGMTIKPAPSFAEFPIYNADLQAVGFPADVTSLGEAIRSADGVVFVSPEYKSRAHSADPPPPRLLLFGLHLAKGVIARPTRAGIAPAPYFFSAAARTRVMRALVR